MMRTPTNIKIEGGTSVYIANKPCTACGCYEAFVFECNCGEVHSDVCYNCGGFVDAEHEPIERENEGIDQPWAGRCTAGAVEHVHTWPYKEPS